MNDQVSAERAECCMSKLLEEHHSYTPHTDHALRHLQHHQHNQHSDSPQ